MSKNIHNQLISKGSKHNKTTYSLLFLIIFLQTALLLVHMHRKTGFHIDEIWSYSFANCLDNEIYFSMDKSYPDLYGKWVDGSIFKKYLTVQQEEKFSYRKVYENQIKDMHPPLYSFLIHSLCSFFHDSFSKWYGNVINIIFFLLSQILLFYLVKKLFSEETALLTVFFYGFSAAAINTFIFIRMYAMLLFLTLSTTLVYIKALESEEIIYSAIAVSILVTIGALTQYFYLIYAFYLTIIFEIICIFKKKYKNLLFISLAALLGVITAYFIFPEILNDLTAKTIFIEKGNGFKLINIIWQKEFWYFVLTNLIGMPSSLSETVSIILNSLFILVLFLISFSLVEKKLTANKFTDNSSFLKLVVKIQKTLKEIRENHSNWLIFFLPNYLFVITVVGLIKFIFLKDFSVRYFFTLFPYLSVVIVIFLEFLDKNISFNGIKGKKVTLILTLSVFCISGQIFNLHFLLPESEPDFPEGNRASFFEKFNNSSCILLTPNPVYIHDLVLGLKDCKRVYNINNLNQIKTAVEGLNPKERNIILLPLVSEDLEKLLLSKYKIKGKKILLGKNFLIYYDVFEVEVDSKI